MFEHVAIRDRVKEDDDSESLRAAVYARTPSTTRAH